jgi:hypothetical protein
VSVGGLRGALEVARSSTNGGWGREEESETENRLVGPCLLFLGEGFEPQPHGC